MKYFFDEFCITVKSCFTRIFTYKRNTDSQSSDLISEIGGLVRGNASKDSTDSENSDFGKYGGWDAQTDAANIWDKSKATKEEKALMEYQTRLERKKKDPTKQEESHVPTYVGLKPKYHLMLQLGSGSFGKVYIGKSKDGRHNVAIKLEKHDIPVSQLMNEHKNYQTLRGGFGIPNVQWIGEVSTYKVLIMDLLGPDLEFLFTFCGRSLSYKCVLLLVDQILTCLEGVHSKNLVHRDIKSSNFCIGHEDDCHQLYLLDFGLAKEIILTPGYECQKVHNCLVGTPAFASLNSHMGNAQSFRDDLESVGYLLIYLLLGRLPWEKLDCKSHNDLIQKIKEYKETMSPDQMCANLPKAFVSYMEYVKKLHYKDRPDYQYLRGLFKNLANDMGIKYDYHFDWIKLAARRQNKIKPKKAPFGSTYYPGC